MNSGRSGSKGKGYRPKEPASTNQNSAQNPPNSNSDRTARGSGGSSSQLVSSSGTERTPSGLSAQSVWGSGNLNFSVGEHSIVVPIEGNSASSAPSAAIGSQERKSTEVQENPHGLRESKGIAGGASQDVEETSGKSAEEPSGSISLRPSRLNSKQKQRDEGYTANFVARNSTQGQSQVSRGNEGQRSSGHRGGRGGGRGGYGYQRGVMSGNEGECNWNRGGRGASRGGDGSQRRESDKIDALGRCLSSVLRHRAANLKLNIRSDGYVTVNDLLNLNMRTHAGVPLHSHTVDDIKEAVKRDNKQRFGLREENNVFFIRANQGHSIQTINTEMLLEPILSAENLPVCVHGTYLNNLDSIKKNGLSRMKRNHVHFARGLSTDNGVISGMRSDCEVLIYLDVQKALQDGMKLFVSENGVILTEGFNGVVPPKYFANIEKIDRKRNRKY